LDFPLGVDEGHYRREERELRRKIGAQEGILTMTE